MDISGQVAIVTGSSKGIGAAIAERLAERGAKVVINYSSSEKEAREVEAKCAAHGADVLIAQGNVAEDGDCRRIVDETLARFGRVDILVNNAGTTKFADHADLEALSAEDFQWIYAVNVIGAYQMIRACTPSMKKQGYGAVLNMASIAGVTGIGSSVAYAASKGALNTMTLSLARSLAPEIRVNALCPGFVGTGWFKEKLGENYDAFEEGARQAAPLKRAGTPEDIADAAVFFCAEGARHITGETLLIDAGLHLMMSGLTQR